MKKYFTASTIALITLLLAGVFLGLWFLQSSRFQEFARSALIARIEKATGLDCRMERAQFQVLRGRFAIAGFSLTPHAAAPGLVSLKVDEIRATISISSLWHFRMRLAELDIEHPQVELRSGDEASTWNPEEIIKTLKMSLRLEAGRVQVHNGRIKVNERTAPFNLSFKDLDCAIRYSGELPGYKINLKYEQGRIFWEKRTIVHDLTLSADLSLQGVAIEFFKFRYHTSLLTGNGSFRNWASPVLQIHAAGLYDSRDLTLAHPSINKGRGVIGVTADIRNDRQGIEVKGSYTIRAGGYRGMDFRDLAGQFHIKRDVLHLHNVSAKIAQGSVQIDCDIQLREANKEPNRVAVTSKGVPVIEIGRLLDLPLLNFENITDGTTSIVWKDGDRDLQVDCDAVVHSMTQASSSSGVRTPLDGTIKFTYWGTGEATVASANLRSSASVLHATGLPDNSFRVEVSTSRIAEPLILIAEFSPPVAGLISRQPDVLSMVGHFSFGGDVRIKSSADVTYRGDASVRNGQWRAYKVDTMAAYADFVPPRLQLRNTSIHSGSQTVEGTIDLDFADQEQISNFGFQGKVRKILLASLRDFGADTSNIGGLLSGSGSISYESGAWEGAADFLIEKGHYKGEDFDSLRTKVQLKEQRLRMLEAEAHRGSAHVGAEGTVDLKNRLLDLTMRLKNLSLAELPLVQSKKLPVRGFISAGGVLSGTFDSPAFNGTLDLGSLQYDSYDLGNGNGSIRFESGAVQGGIRIRSNYGNLAVQATISTASGYPGTANLEFDNLDLQKIIATKTPSYLKEISTALNGKVEIAGQFDNPSTLKINGEVDGAHFKIQDYELHNARRLQFVVANRNFRLESVQFVGEGTSLVLSGNIPLEDTPQLDLNLNGNINLRLLNGIEKKLRVGGSAKLNIRASGTKKDPQIIGGASFQDAHLDHEDSPFHFTAMQGDMVFSRNLVRLENVRGTSASGTIQISGVLEHQNAVLRSINLGIALRNARLPYPKDFRSIVDADLVLSGTSDVQILSGDINVIRAEYMRSFNLLEQLASGSTIQAGPLTTEPSLMGLRLNIEIHSENGLIVDNELTRLRGSLRLNLRGTPAYPSLTGRVEATEGTIFFRGSRFEISHAFADFVDRNRINPVLEIRAEADVKTYRLILDAIGDLEHLNLSITSDPQMSTVDILSLLTTGKKDTGTTTTQRKSEMVGVSAASVLSENLTGVIGKRVQRILGLESFRVDPFLAGAENDPTARITISERLSKDIVATFSRNLTTNQEQIVVIEYDVTRNLSLVATRDEDGKYGLDFRFRKRLR